MVEIAGVYFCWKVMPRIKKIILLQPKIENETKPE